MNKSATQAKKRVLFLCTGNSCRSQMAEGLWNKLGGGEWEAHSAGSKPAGYVHPPVVEVMKEIAIDISKNRSKHVEGFINQSFDFVATVCDNAKETCPTLPGAKKIVHWPFQDPADAIGTDEQKRRIFRQVRDEIAAAIRRYLKG